MPTAEELAGLHTMNDALRRRVEDLSLLFKISSHLHSAADLDQIYALLLTAATAGHALGFNRAFVFMANPDRTFLEGVMGVGPQSWEEASRIWNSIATQGTTFDALLAQAAERTREERAAGITDLVRGIRIPLRDESGLLEMAFASRHALCSWNTPGESTLNRELREKLQARHVAAAPILARDVALGVIAADNLFTGAPISFHQVELLGSLANQAGIAIQNARTFANVRRRFQELQTLQEVGKGLLSTVEILHDLGLIARISAQVLNAAGSLVRLLDPQEEEDESATIPVQAAFGLGERLRSGGGWALEEALAREVVSTGSSRLLRPPYPDEGPGGLGPTVTTLMIVPLVALDKTVGCLSVVDDRPVDRWGATAFSEDDLRFLSILAGQAAISIENARLFERLRSTERRLRETQALALRSEKLAALGQVTSQVAHEIRNPLAAIGGFARSVRGLMAPDDPLADRVDIIVQEAARLERFLRNQLDYLHAGEPLWAPVSLSAVAEEALALVAGSAEAQGVRLESELDKGIPRIVGDADQLKQVLLNLLQNALEGAGRGGCVKITTGQRAERVEAQILDSGPPIPPETLTHLFVPFFSTKAGGSGLGLPISQNIVQRHGGWIDVKREEEWTVFIVSLPLEPPKESPRG